MKKSISEHERTSESDKQTMSSYARHESNKDQKLE